MQLSFVTNCNPYKLYKTAVILFSHFEPEALWIRLLTSKS